MIVLLKTNNKKETFTLTLAKEMSHKEAASYIHKELKIGCEIVKFL